MSTITFYPALHWYCEYLRGHITLEEWLTKPTEPVVTQLEVDWVNGACPECERWETTGHRRSCSKFKGVKT